MSNVLPTRPPAGVLTRGQRAGLGEWLSGERDPGPGSRQAAGRVLAAVGLAGVLVCVAVGILTHALAGAWWFLVVALALALATMVATGRAARRSSLAIHRVDLFSDGLLVQQPGRTTPFRAEEAEVYHALGAGREVDAAVYDVMDPDGHTVRLHGQVVPGFGRLGARFADQVVAAREERDRADFLAGEPLSFGPITLANSGLVCANERTSETDTSGAGIGDPAFDESVVAWPDGPSVTADGAELVISVPAEADVTGFPRRVDRVLVPNPDLLLRLVERFVREARA